MKVLLVEPLKPHWMEVLAQRIEVVVSDSPAETDLLKHANSVDAIIIRAKGKISARVIEEFSPRLKVIGRHGTGVDHIDLAAAKKNGVTVVNTPQANVRATAEFTVALMLSSLRRVIEGDRLVRAESDWRLADKLTGFDLQGKKIGLIGFGKIGQSVGRICSFGFGMEVLYWDYLSREIHSDVPAIRLSMEDLLDRSDIVSIHVPFTKRDTYLIGRGELGRMRHGSLFINTARGQLVDEEALIEALQLGKLRAALDVMAIEPLRDSRLQLLENVVLTPHIASYTAESFHAMGEVVEDVLGVLQGEAAQNPVVEVRNAQ